MRWREQSAWTWLGLLMVLVGVAGLGHRTFSYTEQTTQATIGAVEIATNETHRFRIPLGVSAGLITAGAALLFWRGRT